MAVLNPSLLIVDDDPDICQALTDFLEYERYQVKTVGTGEEAVARAEQYRFDAAILDLGLPDTDGLSLFRRLAEIDPNLPVIILTALNSEEKRIESFRQGATAYLTKPYNKEELKTILRQTIRESRA
jgi:DNA-binding response OmpR family regulator